MYLVTDYLARITAYSGPTSSWQYVYAPTGDRIAKQHVGLGFEDDNQWDLNSDGDVLASYHKSGASEVFDSIYVSPSMDGRLARIDSSGTASYYMNDALNSVHQVTGPGGALAGTDFNDAWGNPIDIGLGAPGGLDGRFSYTNRERDNESGLMFYRARSYDPITGRFTSRDPKPGANLYTYVANAPTLNTDPSGEEIKYYSLDEFQPKEGLTAQKYYDQILNDPLKGGEKSEEAKRVLPNGTVTDKWTVKETNIGDKDLYEEFHLTASSLSDKKAVGMQQIVQALQNAKENDHLIFQVHGYTQKNDADEDIPTGIWFAEKETITFKDFITALGAAKTKAKTVTFLACHMPKSVAEDVRAAIGTKTLYFSKHEVWEAAQNIGILPPDFKTEEDKTKRVVDAAGHVTARTFGLKNPKVSFDPTLYVTDDKENLVMDKVVDESPPKKK